MRMLVHNSQDHKKAKDHKMMIRDYAWFMISKKFKIDIQVKPIRISSIGNKMHKAFPLLGESSHWQYNFPLPVEGVPTARRMEIPLPRVCTAMMKKLPVKENWQLMLPSIKLQLLVLVNAAQEDSIRSDLRIDDAKETACLLNEAIFEGLARMGAKTTAWNEFSSTMASAIICSADNQSFSFSKYIFDNMVKSLEGGIKFYLFPRFLQIFLNKQVEGMKKQKPRRKQRNEAEVSHDESEDEDHVPTPSSDPLPSEAKDAQSKEIDALKKKVSKLLKWRKTRSGGLRRLMKIGSDADTQGRKNNDEMFGVDDLSGEEVVLDTTTGEHEEQIIEDVSTAELVTTAGEAVTTIFDKADSLLAERLQERERERFSEGRSYDEIKKLFDREMRKVNDFIAMDSEAQKSSGKKVQESSTKITAKSLESDISKKQKVDENVEPVIDDTKELKNSMMVGDLEDIGVASISTSSPSSGTISIHF
nr:hypothetical protein [Tanacetum cinerariifolium]